MARGDASIPPLYTFDSRNFTINSSNSPTSYLKVSDGNHIKYYARNRGSSFQAYFSLTNTATSFQSSWPAMFTLHTGDTVVLKLKNIYLYSNQGTSYHGYVNFRLKTSGTETNIIGWNANPDETDTNYVLHINGKETKRIDELSKTVQLTGNKNVGSFCVYNGGSGQAMYITLEADIELYVNGVRYI